MTVHECKICLKTFKRRVDLVYHIDNKKKPCKPNIKNELEINRN